MSEFRDGVGKAVAYAKELGVGQLNCLVGKVPQGVSEDVLRKTVVDNLRFAAAELQKVGLRLLIEPINTFDIPGFYLNRTVQAIEILDEVGSFTGLDTATYSFTIPVTGTYIASFSTSGD